MSKIKRLFFFVFLSLLAIGAKADSDVSVELRQQNTPSGWTAVQLPNIPAITNENTFNITNYGAAQGTDNSAAINAAITAANAAGGGMVVIPAGTWLSGPITMKSNVVLHMSKNCTLKLLPFKGLNQNVSAGEMYYPVTGWTSTTKDGKTTYSSTLNNFINNGGVTVNDIIIEGEGETSVIDGQGAPWWKLRDEIGDYTRPNLIRIEKGARHLFRNFKTYNAVAQNIVLGRSGNASNITVHDITIQNPSSEASTPSHNTDGFPIWGPYVNIYNCNISTGDDNIVCDSKAHHIHAWNITCGDGHGMSIGSYTSELHDVIYEGITFNGTGSGFRFKTNNDRSGNDQTGTNGAVKNIICRNATMTGCPSPIKITSWYDKDEENPASNPTSDVSGTTPEFCNILFQNITASAVSGKTSWKHNRPIYLYGRPEMYVHDITFDNVKINSVLGMFLAFAKNVTFKNGCKVVNTNGSAITTEYLAYSDNGSTLLSANASKYNGSESATTYAVTFKNGSATYKTYNICPDSYAYPPADPTKANATFLGWATTEGGTPVTLAQTQLARGGTFYAVWDGDDGGDDNTGGTDKFWKFDSGYNTSYESNATVDGLNIVAESGKAISINSNSKTDSDENINFTTRLQLGGSGSTTSRNVNFAVTGPCTIEVWAVSGKSGESRDLKINDGTETTILATGNDLAKGTYNYTGNGGTIYLYSGNSGINLYGIRVTYSNTPTASDSNPIDVTEDYITNPGFDGAAVSGNKLGAWTWRKNGGNGPQYPYNATAANTTAAEFWNETAASLDFDLYQTLSGMPAGTYKLSAKAGNSLNGQATNGNNGRVMLYAMAGSSAPNATPYGCPSTPVNVTTGEATATSTYDVYFTVTAGQDVTIGFKTFGTMEARWFYCDDFTLTYYGTNSAHEVTSDATATGSGSIVNGTETTPVQKASNEDAVGLCYTVPATYVGGQGNSSKAIKFNLRNDKIEINVNPNYTITGFTFTGNDNYDTDGITINSVTVDGGSNVLGESKTFANDKSENSFTISNINATNNITITAATPHDNQLNGTIVFTYKYDVQPLELQSTAKTSSRNGSVTLKFNNPMAATTAKATVNGKQFVGDADGTSVTFVYSGLDYGQSYTFTLPAGSLTDEFGQTYDEAVNLTITTDARPTTTKKAFDQIVSNGEELAAAIAAANNRGDKTSRYRIFVKKGAHVLPTNGTTTGGDGKEYPDPRTTLTGANVSIIGEDYSTTSFTNITPAATWDNGYGTACPLEGIGNGDVLIIDKTATDSYFQGITIKTSMGDAHGRDIAVNDQSNKTIMKDVCLWGYQDTYVSNNSNGRFYFDGGVLRGRTDYLCGKGDVYYDKVTLQQVGTGGYLAVPSLPTKYGYVFNECYIKKETNDVTYYLGRPWGQGTPIALFINTKVDAAPIAAGWDEMSNGWPYRLAEYNTRTTSDAVVPTSGRKTTFASTHPNNPVLTADEAEFYGNMARIMGGTDGWDPTEFTVQCAAPAATLSGTNLTWNNDQYASSWIVFKDGEYYANPITNSLALTEYGTYTVRAANAMGGLGEASAAVEYVDDHSGTVNATVKMTWVDKSNPTVSKGEVATAQAGYNKISNNTVGFENEGWNCNWITYIQVDASKVPTNRRITSATLTAKVSGSTDNKRNTEWGVGYNNSEWSSAMTYDTANRSIVTLGATQWTSYPKNYATYSSSFVEKQFDITNAFTNDDDNIVTILVYEKQPGGGYIKDVSVSVDYDTPVFDVTFHNGDAQYGETQHVEIGNTVNKPTDPEKDGYIFQGWSITDGGKTAERFPYTVTAATDFYAIWEVDRPAKLIHTGSTSCGTDNKVVTYTIDAVTEHYNNEGSGTWQGYAFAQFDITIPDGKQVKNASLTWRASTTATTDRQTIIYTLNNGQTVDFDAIANNTAGLLRKNAVKTQVYKESWRGEKTVETDVTEVVKNLTNNGQKTIYFQWTGNEGGADLYGKASANAPTLDVEFEDIPVQTYTVTFYDGDTQYGEAQEIEEGLEVSAPTAPTKDGYTFQGWSLTNGGTTAEGFPYTITEAKTFYAIWEEEVQEPTTVTWDFSEYTSQVNLNSDLNYSNPTYAKEYTKDGMTVLMVGTESGNDSKGNAVEYVKNTSGFHCNGASSSSTRYIKFTPTVDGVWKVTGKGNGKSVTRIVAISTSVETFSTMAAKPNTVLAAAETSDGTNATTPTIEANLTAGTTYYAYFATGGSSITKLQFVYTAPSVDPTPQNPAKGTAVVFDKDTRYSKWVIDSRIGDFYANTNAAALAVYDGDTKKSDRSGKATGLDYVPGLVAKAVIEAADYYKDETFAKSWFNSVADYANACYNSVETSGGSLDNLNAVKMYFGVNELSKDGAKFANNTTYLQTLTAMNKATSGLSAHNNTYSIQSGTLAGDDVIGGWFHKSEYNNQMWCDGQYMGPALLAQLNNYGYKINNSGDWDLITKQFEISWNKLWNPTDKLLYHAFEANAGSGTTKSHAETWAGLSSVDPKVFHSAAYWGRAEGWYFLALVDVLEQMQIAGISTSDANYTRLRGYLNDVAAGLAVRQDATSGCWYQLLDEDGSFHVNSYRNGTSHTDTYNYLESSATAIFTAAYLKGMRLGLYDTDYTALVKKAYSGFVNKFMYHDGEGGVHIFGCSRSAGLGGTNETKSVVDGKRFRDGSKAYYLLGYDVWPTKPTDNGSKDPTGETTLHYGTEGKVLGAFIMAATEYERMFMDGGAETTYALSEDMNYTEFAEGTYETVTVKRTFNDKEWTTFVVPFDVTTANLLQAFAADPTHSEVAVVDRLADNKIYYTTKASITANTPVLIKIASPRNDNTYTFSNVTVVNPTNNLTKESDGVNLVGLYEKKTYGKLPAELYFLYGNKFYDRSYLNSMKPFRAYFLPTISLGAKGIQFFDAVEDDPTGVITVGEDAKADEIMYNALGQRVSSKAKGFIIKGTKKYSVR